jgi:3-deoxy-D-manno-octulosonic acid (KDO) 8-phosphate synthase
MPVTDITKQVSEQAFGGSGGQHDICARIAKAPCAENVTELALKSHEFPHSTESLHDVW